MTTMMIKEDDIDASSYAIDNNSSQRRSRRRSCLKPSEPNTNNTQHRAHPEQNRSVHLCYDVLVYPTLSLCDYTEEERDSSWFQRSEYDQIKSNNKILAIMMSNHRQSFPENDVHICYRGLESWTAEGLQQRRHARLNASFALFDEQCRQWDHQDDGKASFDSSLLLSMVYASFTRASQKRDCEHGIRDYAAATSAEASLCSQEQEQRRKNALSCSGYQCTRLDTTRNESPERMTNHCCPSDKKLVLATTEERTESDNDFYHCDKEVNKAIGDGRGGGVIVLSPSTPRMQDRRFFPGANVA